MCKIVSYLTRSYHFLDLYRVAVSDLKKIGHRIGNRLKTSIKPVIFICGGCGVNHVLRGENFDRAAGSVAVPCTLDSLSRV